MNSKINQLLIPNVSKLPKQKSVDFTGKLDEKDGSEFKGLLEEKISDLSSRAENEHGIRLSLHASRRIQERNLAMDGEEFYKLKDAIDKLRNKGGRDSLIITNNAAYIVDVDKNTIVTAIDKDDVMANVFTKIDSTLVVN